MEGAEREYRCSGWRRVKG